MSLDFMYVAPGREQAENLAEFIRSETDYDVTATSSAVTGSTQTTTLDPEKLDQWVTWMVLAGDKHGRCEFDGWGTQVP